MFNYLFDNRWAYLFISIFSSCLADGKTNFWTLYLLYCAGGVLGLTMVGIYNKLSNNEKEDENNG